MKRTKEEAARTRQLVMNAAIEVFARKGFAHTTLAEVAKAAGMTRGAIYWHFNNKFQLLSAIVEKFDREFEERIISIFNQDTPPLTRIKKVLMEILSVITRENHFRVSEEIMVFKSSKNGEYRELYELHLKNVQRYRSLMIKTINEGLHSGDIDSRFNAETIVVALTSFISGIKSSWLDDVLSMSNSGFQLTDKIEDLADLFIGGFKV